MQEKFEEYSKKLQDFERQSIITEAKTNLEEAKSSLESTASSANSTTTAIKSFANAETIANCAFDALKKGDVFTFPLTATLDSYLTEPLYDSYGRVMTSIECSYQNRLGNYFTERIYVVLQSCTTSGEYTYLKGMYYTRETAITGYHNLESAALSAFLSVNDWDEDPNYDSTKDKPYQTAIQMIKDGEYGTAIKELEKLDGYRKSTDLIDRCKNKLNAESYSKAIELFSKGNYAEAKTALTALLDADGEGYLKTKRVIKLCDLLNTNSAAEATNDTTDNVDTKPSNLPANSGKTPSTPSGNNGNPSVGSNVPVPPSGNAKSTSDGNNAPVPPTPPALRDIHGEKPLAPNRRSARCVVRLTAIPKDMI